MKTTRVTAEERAEMVAVYLAGATLQEAAARFGYTSSVARSALKTIGARIRQRGGSKRRGTESVCANPTCGKRIYRVASRVRAKNYCSSKCQGALLELTLPPLTDRQLEVINGCLLGNGSIIKGRSNCYFTESHTVRHREYVEALANELDEWFSAFDEVAGAGDTVINGRPAHSGPSVRARSKCHRFWTGMRARWYPGDKKTVPPDLTLTPLTVAHWYCGDGTFKAGRCIFCTNGFTAAGVDSLVGKLKDQLGLDALRLHQDGRWVIYIRCSSLQRFVNLVESHIPWQCFQYKLAIREWLEAHPKRRALRHVHWAFVSPNGVRHEATCLKTFCEKHGLSRSGLSELAHGKYRQFKGWTRAVD